ncbi:phosphopyruvate hydratase [Patescibacteria group bacterium]|nr:phosphopyruvate hydratase [Patescibacteria group bacterium]
MPKISSIKAHKIVDSRGVWTVDTKVTLENGLSIEQPVPSGASRGENEAIYLPVEKSIEIINGPLSDALVGEDPSDQKKIDSIMLEMDGTHNKSHLGGNSILSISLAVSKLAAITTGVELYEYLSQLYGVPINKSKSIKFPTPLFNVLNGGKHAQNKLSFQEFMIIPAQGLAFKKKMEMGVEIYHSLKKLLMDEGLAVGVGDEGGFAPDNLTVHKALEMLMRAVKVSHEPGKDVFLGMDVAAESFESEKQYNITEENLSLTTPEFAKYYQNIVMEFPLIYVEDPFYERDFEGWKLFHDSFAERLLVVGDDLVVTNPNILKKTLPKNLINAVIVKPNQVGTLTETLEFIRLAKENGLQIAVSHRSGDNPEDSFIADLALAVEADFIKSGAPVRGERIVKYNRLLDICSDLGIE